jgi:ribonuclease HI
MRIGRPTANNHVFGAACDNKNLANAINQPKDSLGEINARQAFIALQPPQAPVDVRLPYKCKPPPPAEINVYTDGSWKHPRAPNFSLGGAGVWWPGRTHLISEAELEFAEVQRDPDGVRLCTSIGGYAGSSTRTELAAGILAVCSHGPVHIGSDSLAFVTKANLLLQLLQQGHKPHKNWLLASDGDLWHQFQRVATAKGPASIKITWVKGHATEQHVQEGITTEAKRAGNNEADTMADKGTKLHGENVTYFADSFSNRHKWYSLLYFKITKHITEAYMIHRELTRIREAKLLESTGSDSTQVTYTPLWYPDASNSSSFIFQACITQHAKTTKANPRIKNIQDFMQQLDIVKIGEGQRGITWIELYILYRIYEYEKPLSDPKGKAAARTPIDRQFDYFKTLFRKVAERVVDKQDMHDVFKPASPLGQNLLGVGIEGRHAALNFNITIPKDLQDEIALRLVALGCSKKRDCRNFLHKELKLKPAALTLRAKVPWDADIPKQQPQAAPKAVICVKASSQPDAIDMHIITCPKCGNQGPVGKYTICYNKLDHTINCRMCHKSSESRHWKCNCSVPWFTCRKHQPDTVTQKHKASSQNADSDNPKHKRSKILVSNPDVSARRTDLSDILDKELLRESKRARRVAASEEDITFHLNDASMASPIPVNMIPPSLRDRFPSICSRSV